MSNLTLLRQGDPLADPLFQRQQLERPIQTDRGTVPPFHELLSEHGIDGLRSASVEILQLNVGRVCNQTCRHCHVDAGPDRRESMTREVFEACLDLLDQTEIATVDITGGAPEMNPHFRWFVEEVSRRQRKVIDRCNLTILLANGFTDLPEFLAAHRVEIIASLPCYLEKNTDQQRGRGVYEKSISALQRLNALGYAQPDSGLTLNLVFNPAGPSLPPPQAGLEAAYREQLQSRFQIQFNRLYTLTNLPISRFLQDLLHTGRYEEYVEKLVNAFNPHTLEHLMCRNTLSVDHQGRLFDCDFNQMLDLPVAPTSPQTIFDLQIVSLFGRPIMTGRHCLGCTAGAGSSCQGALVG